MSDPCDQFTVGDVLPGGAVIVRIEHGKVYVGGLYIAGAPIEAGFDCSQFFTGFYSLLDLLGIPHP